MFVKPLLYTYTSDEIFTGKNKLQFQRGLAKIVWELNAEKVLVYIFSNIVQVIGEWYELDSSTSTKGVLNVKLTDEEIAKARFGRLTAPEITALPWDDWFIYRVDKKEENTSGKNSITYQEAR